MLRMKGAIHTGLVVLGTLLLAQAPSFVVSFSARNLKRNAFANARANNPFNLVFQEQEATSNNHECSRRDLLHRSLLAPTIFLITSSAVAAAAALPPVANAALQESLDIDNFLRTGIDAGGNMGVSSQAGKSRPQTGVVLRDGSEVSQDPRNGAVSAELLTGTKDNPQAVLISFACPKWKLETGPLFDVECRDGRTGDGAFVAVTRSTGGKSIRDLPDSFFLERLFDPTGRFSFYGPPTDIKVKKSMVVADESTNSLQRILELSFSNLSQSTNAELPRKALLVATIPKGSDNAVLLVGSASATRWKASGVEDAVRSTMDSFRAVPAPPTSLKLRAKNRGGPPLDF